MERMSNDRYGELVAKQKDQIGQLKNQISQLRDQYSDMKRDYQVQVIRIQRQISTTQKKARMVEEQLRERKKSLHSCRHVQMANEIVDKIWAIIARYRHDESSTPETSPMIDCFPGTLIPEDSPALNSSSFTKREQSIATPAPTCECDSIAARRTRRSSTANVYYKEPSLRGALTPGDPYTFSLEEGIVTPTIPQGYTRTESVRRRK